MTSTHDSLKIRTSKEIEDNSKNKRNCFYCRQVITEKDFNSFSMCPWCYYQSLEDCDNGNIL
jgi:uncharacterized CHY-type Zn-finger protein